jgi:DNA-binding FadR family transcriptional regulator
VSVQQILDVRRTIEMRTVDLATLRRTDKEAQEIIGHAAGMRIDFNDSDKVMQHDIAFHEAIARASRNPLFMLIVGSFHVVTRQTWRIGWLARDTDAVRLANVSLHEAIADAVASSDRARAETLMAEHFDNTVKVLLASGIN